MGVRTPATLSVCAYEQRVVCNQNTQQIIDVSCLRKPAQIYGPAWLRKNSSICCGVLRPLNLCDVCRACVYQVKVVFVKYPDECCPHGCARHARCCSDWLDGTLVGRGWWAFRCAMYRLTAAMCDRRKDGVYCPATELPEGRGSVCHVPADREQVLRDVHHPHDLRQQPLARTSHTIRYDTIRDIILTCGRKPI